MHQSSVSPTVNEPPAQVREAFKRLARRYPALSIRFIGGEKNNGWLVRVSGPFGSATINAPNPLRGATFEAACRRVCVSNTEAAHA